MWPDRILNPGPLTYDSGVLSTALRGPASVCVRVCVERGTYIYYQYSVVELEQSDPTRSTSL